MLGLTRQGCHETISALLLPNLGLPDPQICLQPSISGIIWVSELILTSHCSATRGLLATDHVILNHGQVTWTTPELAPPLLTTTPHQREDVSALDRFNVHRCPTRRVFSGTGIELMTCLPWLDTLTTGLPQPWDHLGRRVEHPTSLNELEAKLQQIWNEMSQDIIQILYASMPDRIASCIRAREGSTGY
ncbi:uncharacterized protein TNCV_229961 [Trichonephila clavipes]|nr:uncharacterized protein TNCV_229961 [Trichonephila clavipes]